MPRVGPFRELHPEKLTPFARLIYDYMVSQTPTLLVSELAADSGISNNAIWSWLKHGIIPRRQTLVLLAERVPDLPLEELLEAAGLPSTEDMRAQRIAEMARLRESVALVERLLMESPDISDAAKAELARGMDGLRHLPGGFLAATDTHHESNALSPANYEAWRATHEAQVYEPEPITTPEQAHGQGQAHGADRPTRKQQRQERQERQERGEPSRPTGQ